MIRELNLLDYFIDDDQEQGSSRSTWRLRQRRRAGIPRGWARCPKPIIVLKSGKSALGNKAVSSHTASLAGDYRVFSDALAQFGVVEAKNETELINFCEALSRYRAPIKGNIGIVTGSGGHGVMAVDICSALGLSVPTLPTEAQDELRSRYPPRFRPSHRSRIPST